MGELQEEVLGLADESNCCGWSTAAPAAPIWTRRNSSEKIRTSMRRLKRLRDDHRPWQQRQIPGQRIRVPLRRRRRVPTRIPRGAAADDPGREAIFHDDEMPSSDSLFEDIEEDLDEEQLELEVEDDLQR